MACSIESYAGLVRRTRTATTSQGRLRVSDDLKNRTLPASATQHVDVPTYLITQSCSNASKKLVSMTCHYIQDDTHLCVLAWSCRLRHCVCPACSGEIASCCKEMVLAMSFHRSDGRHSVTTIN